MLEFHNLTYVVMHTNNYLFFLTLRTSINKRNYESLKSFFFTIGIRPNRHHVMIIIFLSNCNNEALQSFHTTKVSRVPGGFGSLSGSIINILYTFAMIRTNCPLVLSHTFSPQRQIGRHQLAGNYKGYIGNVILIINYAFYDCSSYSKDQFVEVAFFYHFQTSFIHIVCFIPLHLTHFEDASDFLIFWSTRVCPKMGKEKN